MRFVHNASTYFSHDCPLRTFPDYFSTGWSSNVVNDYTLKHFRTRYSIISNIYKAVRNTVRPQPRSSQNTDVAAVRWTFPTPGFAALAQVGYTGFPLLETKRVDLPLLVLHTMAWWFAKIVSGLPPHRQGQIGCIGRIRLLEERA